MSDAATRRDKQPGKVRTFAELVKFEHSIFALPYAYIGALYGAATVMFAVPAIYPDSPAAASRRRGWRYVPHVAGVVAALWITVAMVGARSFAFVVNRAVDTEIDARNPRTAGRPIPAGTIRRGSCGCSRR